MQWGYGMSHDKGILDLEERQKLYKIISNTPGTHIDMVPPGMQNHLKYFLNNHLMKMGNNGSSNRIFVCNGHCNREKELLELLRQEIPCRMFLHLIFSLPFKTKELAEELRISPSDLYVNLKKLLDLGVIEPAFVKDGEIFPFRNNGNHIMITDDTDRERFYIIKDQKMINDVYMLIIKHKESMKNTNFIESHITLLKNREKISPKENINFEKAVNLFVKELEEMFPSPFHL